MLEALNEAILAEYYAVLERPKLKLDLYRVRIILDLIRRKATSALVMMQSYALPDRGDETFLEAALAAAADYLITGNKRHFPEELCKGQRVVSPGEFLGELTD